MGNEEYTIIVGEERFVLTRNQLLSDPGNHFAAHFLYDEAQSGNRELVVHREPLFFKLIQAHLRGYNVFPIPDAAVPFYMTRETMFENLIRDARFFGLGLLEQIILSYAAITPRSDQKKKFMFAEAVEPYGGWSTCEISKKGFEVAFLRFKHGNGTKLAAAPGFAVPEGYILVGSWREADGDVIRKYAILESVS